ncbi:hypothetical protein AUI46_05545 [archaeon 13_1_40CM_2_52_13]|nr:MAG: hypothetical protein AUI46_05545 [archaeon 13_1_40CM_2_52_13]
MVSNGHWLLTRPCTEKLCLDPVGTELGEVNNMIATMELESELKKRLKGIQWQNGNCLSCIWFATKDPLNADLLDRAKCIHPKLKIYQLVVSGRDWCNLYEEIKQNQIENKQELALNAEEKSG